MNSIEETRGYKEYDSKVKNLEGIFNKTKNILNITKYQQELNTIKQEVANDSSLSNDMMSFSMQMDFEGFAYIPYTKRLDKILEDIETEVLPFYELHLLTSKVDIGISNISCDNIGEVIQTARKLLDTINSLNTHNEADKNALIAKAYQSLYSVIMYEEIFERNDILTYLNFLNNPTNRENIGRLLEKDLQKLNSSELIDEDLRTIRTEGLGYDYLSPVFIQKVSRRTVGETNSEYQARKTRAISSITSKVQAFASKKDGLVDKLNNNKTEIRQNNLKRTLLLTKALAVLMIPIITYNAGKSLGKNKSDKITEYKTITRTIDLNTGKVVGEPTESYDEKETTYVATVMEYSPWRKNPTGVGYISNVTAYEYIVPEDVPEDYHLTKEDLTGNVLKKYSYVEPKDTLEEKDSTTESTILIIETYQDKNATRKSTKYIIPFTVTGAIAGIIIDLILILLPKIGFTSTIRIFEQLSAEIHELKLSNEEIRALLTKMQEEVATLQVEYDDTVKKYGSIEEQFTTSNIDYSFLINNEMKRTRKNKGM